MLPIYFLTLLLSTNAITKFSNLHIFINRFHAYGNARFITTLETLGDTWFTTKVSINERRLVDYFQTNTTELRESLLWYKTTNLRQTLIYFGINVNFELPYEECYYHISRAQFFFNGYNVVSALLTTDGLYENEVKTFCYTFVSSERKVSCEPRIKIPHCDDSNRPFHYETSGVIVLRAIFLRHCPMDRYIQYYWTLHDSTESRK
ncbi:uncharacterized protein [Drosophila tropicalis]|uniref:uncharacterized protein n=1 Tax=Drosophila tropicalis TaxID=46794 RepID=UPI0035AC1431